MIKDKNFSTLEEFIENYNNCTFGLNIITCTEPSFKSKKTNNFIGDKIEKITFYKNAMCGCSYQKAIENAIKTDFPDLKGEMQKAVLTKANEVFDDKLPWGKWLNYPFIIEHTNGNGEYNKYLRVYNNFKRTKIETFYFCNGKLLEKGSEKYNLLLSELQEKKISAKQENFGLKQAVVPCGYKTKNVIYCQQGTMTYINKLRVNSDLENMIQEIFSKL